MMDAATERAAPRPLLVVDGHVHLHAAFDVAAALGAAAANMAAAAERIAPGAAIQCALCLVETAGAERFTALAAAARSGAPVGAWTPAATAEPHSVMLRQAASRAALFVIAGRQIVTRDRLEVLAIGTAARFDDGASLESTIDAVVGAGGAAVLPYGVGKWRGRRGSLVDSLVAAPRRPFYIGDNGNRLEWGGLPPQFAAAERARIRIVPGSDPLPLPGEEQRIGAYGFTVEAALPADRPAAALLALLAGAAALVPYGRRERLARFVRNQLAMQIAKRRAA
jgi:hypothetical protein